VLSLSKRLRGRSTVDPGCQYAGSPGSIRHNAPRFDATYPPLALIEQSK